MFNTLAYAKKAKEIGFTQSQAEFQAEEMAKIMDQIDMHLATKQDLEDVREKLLYQFTIRFGGMLVTAVTVLGILITLLHSK